MEASIWKDFVFAFAASLFWIVPIGKSLPVRQQLILLLIALVSCTISLFIMISFIPFFHSSRDQSQLACIIAVLVAGGCSYVVGSRFEKSNLSGDS